MNLTKKRWIVLIASCLINLCIGALYAWSVFASPMATYLTKLGNKGMSASSLSIVFSLANLVGPITMINGGKLVKKLGSRKLIMLGGVWFGLGMIICGFAKNLLMLILGFGLSCGLAMGLTYGCVVSNCVKFFPDKKGLVGGITTASYGLSSVLVPLLANYLISSAGVNNAFKLLGIGVVIIVSISSIFVISCPDDFIPSGYINQNTVVTHKKDYTWQEMIQSPVFYLMITILCTGAFMGMMIISQVSPIAQSQILMNAKDAAMVVSVLALFNTAGRIIGGIISDKIGQIETIKLLLMISIIGLFLLMISKVHQVLIFYIGICIIGICFGGFMGIYPGFTNDQFGSKYANINYGIMFIGFALSGFSAPILIGMIYTKMNSYLPAYIMAMTLSLIGLILVHIYKGLQS